MNARYDCIVIGAGPAGMTSAKAATSSGMRVLVLDKADRPGVKLLLAGGGKGNVTNRNVFHTDYVGEQPAFARNVLARISPDAVLKEFKNAGIPLEERAHGRIFCKSSARAVLDHLLANLPTNLCQIRTATVASSLSHTGGVFTVTCGSMSFNAPNLIVATGSPAWPQCGADDSGLRLVRSMGHRIVPPKPVLVPLVMPPSWPLSGLAGISTDVCIVCDVPGCPEFNDALLFTHKGLSGPAALQISCWWRKGAAVCINFLPGQNASSLLDTATGKATPRSVFSRHLPERLLDALFAPEFARQRVAELSRKQRTSIAGLLHAHIARPLRTEGMTKAEAASGGVDTDEINPVTLESRLAPGLFFCGEILDITGRLGGYNLHWAWASGTVAGESTAKR